MNKKTGLSVAVAVYIVLVQIIALLVTNYNISYDEHYVNSVYDRAFEKNDKSTDFKQGVVAYQDAEGKYEDKVWKLQNKEVYYFQYFGLVNLFGALLFLIVFGLISTIR